MRRSIFPRGWKTSPKSFIALIGAEYDLLVEAGSTSIMRFLTASLLILVVAILTFVSIFYAMEMIFHHPYVEWLMAIFISGLFITIYIFLINTFSKKGQVKEKQTGTWDGQFTLANSIRTGFILFIAFLIAYPLEVLMFSAVIDQKVERYKSSLIENHNAKVHQLYNKESAIIEQKLIEYTGLWNQYPTGDLQQSIKNLEKKLIEINNQEQRDLFAVNAKVQQSDFLLYRIQLVSRYPYCWLITLAVMVIFFLPGYLIYSIASDDAYYRLRSERDRELITEQYVFAREWYSGILQESCGVQTTLYNVYTDPPFNSQLPLAVTYEAEQKFIEKFSGEIKPNGL
ncbi:MAG: DUF4407 domain-containing protein [Agriterribacter sp.]